MKSQTVPLKSHSSPLDPFSPLEKTGAITARYVHDLSNDASTINASLMVLQSKINKQTPLSPPDVTELQAAIDRLSTRLRFFGETVRGLRVETPRQGSAQAVAIVQAVAATHQGWTCEVRPIKDQLISCEPRWLQFMVNELLTEISVPSGVIVLSVEPLTTADGAPSLATGTTRDYFRVAFAYENTIELALTEKQIQASKRADILAWLELIRLTRGLLKFASLESNHQIGVYLPVADS